jgi:hypothetical protein
MLTDFDFGDAESSDFHSGVERKSDSVVAMMDSERRINKHVIVL